MERERERRNAESWMIVEDGEVRRIEKKEIVGRN
jgi:hypothetical protein